MPHFPKPHSCQRAPRARIGVPTQIQLMYGDGRRTQGRLQTISETGGCAGLETQLPATTLVSIELRAATGPISAIAEMLPPLGAGRQAFRFLAIDEDDRCRLQQMMRS